MRSRRSVRVRLTVGVGVITALFFGAAALLFSDRTADAILDAVLADQAIGVTTLGEQPLSVAALEIYTALDRDAKLPVFWSVIGKPVPSADTTIVFVDPTVPEGADPTGSPREARIVGAADQGSVVLDALTVLSVGELLLSGLSADDLLVVDESPGIAPTGAISLDPSTIGATAVSVGNVRNRIDTLGHELWVASGLLTLLAIGATWLLTGRALRPVEAITRRVDDITSAGSGERVPVPAGDDEIAHLARTVNSMLDRLDRAALAQRRFVADASHELRSPLAVMRTEAEVALAHPAGADWPATTQSMLDETSRLEGLVDDLLALARIDEGRRSRGAAVCDVDEIVRVEAARARRVPVDVGAVLAGRVAAHPSEITRVVRHLLDNAARHARQQVQVQVRTEVDRVLLIVDDDGDGVPEGERSRIFERFARLEESRSRDAGGAGLGLAVVAAVVHETGGTIDVGTAPAGGARFTVRLPALGDGALPR